MTKLLFSSEQGNKITISITYFMYKNLHPHNFVKNKGYSYMHKNHGTVSETHAISSLLLLLLPSVESSRVTTYKELK